MSGIQRYFLTFCTRDRQNHFTGSVTVDNVLGQFLAIADEFSMAVIAWCFMPDHVHLLIEGKRDDADLCSFVHAAKQRTGYEFAQRTRKQLWQPSYYDRVLRDEDATISVVRYIIENPVRGGLVQSPKEYPFVGSTRFTIDQILEAVCWQP